jgi:Papain family cysteine protease
MHSPIKSFGTILRSDPVAERQEHTFGTVVSPKQHPPIPSNFNGREVWRDYLSPIKDQGKCGACYAFSVVGMLADRFAIQTLGQVKPDLNPMEMVVCMKDIEDVTTPDEFLKTRMDPKYEKEVGDKHKIHACRGNTLYNAARSTYVQGTLEEGCVSERDIQRFISKHGRIPMCLELEGDGFPSLCVNKKTVPRYWMSEEYYTVGQAIDEETVTQIKLEIMKWGPVAAGFQVFDDFLTDYTDGTKVYTHPKREQKTLGGHAVRIVGWGEQEQAGRLVKYWQVVNSWGEQWCDGGYGKIEILLPDLQLEQNVVSVWPQILDSDFPYPLAYDALVPKASDEDDAIRAQLEIDPVTMYAQVHVDAIKRGEMEGQLAPAIDPLLLPVYSMFWAFEIGSKPIKIRSGTSVYSLVDGSTSRSRKWILPMSIGVCFALIAWIYFPRYKKYMFVAIAVATIAAIYLQK